LNRLLAILFISIFATNLLVAHIDLLDSCPIDTLLIKGQKTNLFDGLYHTDLSKLTNCDQLFKLQKNISIGKAKTPFDFYFVAQNKDQVAFEGYLYFENVNLDSLSLVAKSNNVTTIYYYSETTPIDQRIVKDLHCVFPIHLEPEEIKEYFLRIRHGELALHANVSLLSTADYMYKSSLKNFLLGAFLGIEMLLILFIPLLFYFKKNYRLTLTYVLYHITILVGLLDFNGILLGYIFPSLAPYEKQITIFLVAIMLVFLVEFVKQLYQSSNSKGIKLFRYSFAFILIVCTFLLPIETYLFHMINGLFILIIFCLCNALWIFYNSFNLDRNISYLFMIGIGSVTVIGIYRVIVKWLGLQGGFLFHNGLMLAYLIEVLCFFGILGYTIYKTEIELKEKELNEKLLKVKAENDLLEERNRIGQELHDDLGSGLTRMKYLAYKANLSESDSKETLSKISKTSDHLISNMREIIWAMDSDSDDIHSFISHCRRYIEEYLKQFNITLHFHSEIQSNFSVAGHVRRKTLLILKESIHNVVKHSNADKVEVKIKETKDSMLKVSIIDNGKGFDPTKLNGHSYGFKNMKTLTSKLNGEMKVEVTDKTKLLFSIPL